MYFLQAGGGVNAASGDVSAVFDGGGMFFRRSFNVHKDTMYL